MKFNLKDKVKELIDSHRKNNKQCSADMMAVIDKWKNPEIIRTYQPDAYQSRFQGELNETLAEAVKSDTVLNQKLKTAFAEQKTEILDLMGSVKDKPADYAAQISNALQFLAIEGDELTDERAFTILKPFIDDFEQMGLFAGVVEKQIGFEKFIDSIGNCTFTKTFGKYNKVNATLNLFNEAEAIAENLFIIPKTNGESIFINYHQYTTKQDGYSEIVAEENILNLLDCISETLVDMPELNIEN